MKKLQMTESAKHSSGASSTSKDAWNAINWLKVQAEVRRLQMRIAKAVREKRYNKAKALQWLLTHSRAAKLLAVKRVTQSTGSKTPGVDGKVWRTSKQKMQAVDSLSRRGYKAQSLRRIYIPKRNGKKRPLSIPTMKDRAMQAVYLLALEPVAEMQADKNSYGFRPKRCAADAIEQCFNVFKNKGSATWVLEGDIKACFDNISHSWLLENVLMDKEMLRKWLTAGHIENGQYFHTSASGTPQGGIISPALLIITLSGLEAAIDKASHHKEMVNVITYADDFIITAERRGILDHRVKHIVAGFLRQRGLMLSEEKSKVTHIEEGFDFLGFNIRKYKGQLLIKPSKANVKAFLGKIRTLMKKRIGWKTEHLIRELNPKIQGWANYFQHVSSAKTFSSVDHRIFEATWRWAKRRHSNKGLEWVKNKYFRNHRNRNWIFSTRIKGADSKQKFLDIKHASRVAFKCHVKIKSAATPYDPKYTDYFNRRKARNKTSFVNIAG